MHLNISAVERLMALSPPGISRTDLAKKSGLSKSYVTELLKGEKPGSSKTWHLLANALGVDVASILIADEAAA